MALATASLLGLGSTQALALALGRIDVLSALGEPLQAEIDLPGISEDEAASLKTTLASPEAFRTAGLVYLPGLNNLQITLEKRGGRSVLLLRGDSPIASPYVDLILEARWADGRTVRGYTVLLPPPRQPQPPTPVEAPVAPAAEATAPPVPAAAAPAPAPEASPAPATVASEARPSNGGAAPSSAPAKPAPARVTVKYGDTAGRIAQSHLPATVSLDQMLIALLRANPDAFVNSNVNRLKAGAVLDLPSEQQAQATNAQEARRLVRAQSQDFNEYRRKLAGLTPPAPARTAERQARGAVEARVEDKKAAAEAADKLTLSTGAVKGKTREDELSRQGNQKEAERQADELTKNIEELKKLSAEITQAAQAPAAAASAASPAAVPASTALAVPATPPPQASAPLAPASVPASAPVSAPQPAASAVSVSLIDQLVANPLIPAAAGTLLALLAALGIYRARRRAAGSEFQDVLGKSLAAVAPEAAKSAAAQGEAATEEAAAPSDVVAEAEAFLAYGREQQAEDILREGLLGEPDRLAIHEKLLEIYAKRLDTANFEDIARRVQRLTGGEGAHWAQACELGIGIDPDNPLYHRSQPDEEAAALPAVEPEQNVAAFDEPAYAEATPPEAEPVAAAPTIELPIPSSLDLSLDTPATPVSTTTLTVEVPGERSAPAEEAAEPSAADLDLDLDALAREQAAPPPRPAEPAPVDFDLNAINLDLGTPTTTPEPAADDPLSIKLALAEEFSAIGDTDGARSLLEEVVAEASGEMRAQAEEALKKLG